MNQFKTIAGNGLWKQNSILVQALGLCPTLAVTTTFTNGVSLGLATSLVMALSSAGISALRAFIPHEIRIPVFILIIAALVTVVDLAFNAWLHELYVILGIFIPLIVTNCIVLARVEAFAAKNGVLASSWDGFAMGFGLTVVLGLLGMVREFLGQGSFLAGIEMIVPGAHAVQLLPEDYPGFLIAILPPGAFLVLGTLIAARNWIDHRVQERARRDASAQAATA